ncbi:sugar transferase [candidate division KSB1 bacterium]|nr:sugar transferase [candidate division KSB1 bacterium]MBL7095099.1 sugar transferase [candidate division KSB1 bacterium]
MSPQIPSNTTLELKSQKKLTAENREKNSGSFSTTVKTAHPGVVQKGRLSLIKHFFVLSFFIDFLIVLSSIFFMNYLKRGDLFLTPRYIYYSFLFIAYWLIMSGYYKKFNPESYASFRKGLAVIFKSSIAILYFIAITLVVIGYYNFSRLQTLGTCALYFFMEATVFFSYYLINGKRHFSLPINRQIIGDTVHHFSLRRFILDFIALSFSFLVLNYLKRGAFDLPIEYEKILLGLYGSWFLMGFVTRKFEHRNYKNVYYGFSPFFKAFLLMFLTMAFFIFVFDLYHFSRFQIFGSFILLIAIEAIYIFLNHIYGFDINNNGDINSVSEAKEIFEEEELIRAQKVDLPKRLVILPVKSKLEHDYLDQDKKLYDFINEQIDLNSIDQADARILDTHNPFNFEILENQSMSLIINLHKINDFRYVNRYFLEVHKKIYNGGYFIGQAHTITTHWKWFKEKFPPYLTKLLYPVDFVFRRIFPKLPVIQKLYFFFTRGKNRILSKAEILGRLYFCGFEALAITEIHNRLYYIAKCVKNPSIDRNPSYGPIISLRRIGYGGNIIYISKLRTMHPYSEYLQDYIYEQNKLQSNGKFDSDFRLTNWGRLLRRMWIDELPQLVNFIRGDVNLIGVRALSQHYFDLYPKELQKLRTQFKPGLVPPYYTDMPASFEEILESERKYLNRKLENRFTTDIEYFFKAFYNIVFKRARSR